MANVEQFNRKYELVAGIPGTNGRKYSDLQIKFEVEKTNTKDPNKAIIEIYNLNKDSRDFFNKKGNFCFLSAGYQLNAGLIFKGSIEQATPIDQDNDYVLKLECKDGIKQYRSNQVNKSYKSGVTLLQLLNDVAKSFSLSIGNIKDIPNITFNTGRVLFGNVSEQLTELTEPFNLKWFIQDEIIYISGVDQPSGNEVISISPASGLIGKPEKLESENKKQIGWRFKILLQPGINPGNLIQVNSEEISNGVFLVKKVKHSGDYTGSDWFTIIEAQEKKG